MIDSFKDLAIGIGALLTALSVLAAGMIFLWKREWRARLSLAIGIDAFKKVGNHYLIQPVCVVKNMGLLRCYVYELKFHVLYLKEGELKPVGDGNLENTKFPGVAFKGSLIKPEWEWAYIEAGIEQRFSVVTHVPEDAVAILIWVKLYHKRRNEKPKKEGPEEEQEKNNNPKEDDFFSDQKVFIIDNGELSNDAPPNNSLNRSASELASYRQLG
jgi:hypothetical protein